MSARKGFAIRASELTLTAAAMSTARQLIWPILGTVAIVGVTLWYSTALVSSPMPPPLPLAPDAIPKPLGIRLRCGDVSIQPDPPAGSPVRLAEAAMYAAMSDLAPDGGSRPVLVEAGSSPLHKHTRRDMFTNWSESAARLLDDPITECTMLTPDRLPAGARLVASADIPRDGATLAARFDGAQQSFAISRARIDEASGDAIVYYERICHPGCGIGEWVWFRRESPAAPWQIARRTGSTEQHRVVRA